MAASGFINLGQDYRTANRDSAGIAPNPEKTPEAVVQVYSARAFNWRGIFSMHTWIATKKENSPHYTVHQVVGWRLRRNLPVVSSSTDIPDRNWFGHTPEVIADLRGVEAAAAIEKVTKAVESYPYPDQYSLWPGPNSNTFTAYVARQVPELGVALPSNAIGKDYLSNGRVVERAPSGTGFQFSLFGMLGFLVARDEGLEVNILGLNFGIDPLGPALKLPFIGRFGFNLNRRTRNTNGSKAPESQPHPE